MQVFYDLHIHSCLSPCADDDMTPNNVCQMAKIKGLDVIAIADHNTALNCQAFVNVGQSLELLVIPAMELQTVEDVHLLCYFPDCESALSFQAVVEAATTKLPNNPKRFGNQYLVDEADEWLDQVPYALILGTNLSLEEAAEAVRARSGVVVPAHINKKTNSVIANLGFIPPGLGNKAVELSVHATPEWVTNYHDYRILRSSDAHQLEQISEAEHFLEIPECTTTAVLKWLGRGSK